MSFEILPFDKNGPCSGWVDFSDTEKERARLFTLEHVAHTSKILFRVVKYTTFFQPFRYFFTVPMYGSNNSN